MSRASRLRLPGTYRDTGTKPKVKVSNAALPKSPRTSNRSPRSQDSSVESSAGHSSPLDNQKFTLTSSPRRISQSIEVSPRSSIRGSPRRSQPEDQPLLHESPKRSPKRLASFDEVPSSRRAMGLTFRPLAGFGVDHGLSFLEFESKYTLERELDENYGLCGAEVTRRGVYTELPDPGGSCATALPQRTTISSLQLAPDGFSFAPGWALNAEHFYQWQQRGKTTRQIYTDWANHYLERGGTRRRVTDLQADLCDGVLLADLVEAVTNQKVIDVNRKPKNTQQMVENVSLCVGALRALGADVGAVSPGELAAGSTLRPVLALLFALSRHKQRAKQLQDMPRLPSPYNKQTGIAGPGCGPGGTSIPLPATVAATRRCPPDKVRPAPAPAHPTQLGGLKHGNTGVGSASSSRSTSPSQQQGGFSFIPQPRNQNAVNRQPAATTPSPRASTVGRPGGLRAPQPSSPYSGSVAPAQQGNKNSVLDKFKLFNSSKEKNQERGKATSGVSKRTSSSSGFSSARSEHSDSSTSLCDQGRTQTVESPKTRALKTKLQAKPTKQASPKTARKEQQVKAQTKITARSKGPDKLAYPPPPEDVTKAGKIANIASKVQPSDRKSSTLDLLKPGGGGQVQKSTSALAVPKQRSHQDPKVLPIQKAAEQNLAQRPKMELPGKIPDPKIHLLGLKGSPIGHNKDPAALLKGSTPTANGYCIRSNGQDTEYPGVPSSPTHGTVSTFDKTYTLNQVNANMTAEQDHAIETQHEIPCKDLDEHSPVQKQTLNVTNSSENDEHSPGVGSGSSPVGHNSKQNAALISGGTIGPSLGTSCSNLAHSPGAGSSIPKPTALVKGTSKPPKDANAPSAPTPGKLKADSVHRKLDPSTVAMVSPMPSISDLMSESSHSNSNSTGQSNSSDSSVIYRPSSESGSDIKTIPNRKIDTTFEQMEKVLSESSTCGGGSLADDEAEMTVKPMQPLLRGYTPGARGLQTLPNRTTTKQYTVLHSSSHHHVGHDYADIDIASGYLSDGEVLRGGMSVASRTLSDLCDGYMSEGGASLYARRVNPSYSNDHDPRFISAPRRDLNAGVKELVSSRRVQKRLPGGSGGGGRSDGGGGLLGGCSGGSDALAELTIEDLASIPASSNHTTANHTGHPSHHHKRVPGGGSVLVGGGVGGGGAATPQGGQQTNNVVYRVVSSRHPGSSGHHLHVKKSDSSQQTDNSAFKQQQQQQQHSNGSNSQQWKKYIEAGAARDRDRDRDRDKETGPPSPSPSRRSQDKHRKQAMAEYANGEKPQKVSSGTSTGSSSTSSKVRGVPQSFGYVKRHSAGTSSCPNGTQNGGKDPTRTAQVSAVPRTKVKVSGGTQTCTTELQANSSGSSPGQGHHYKSYSLTGASASQLSQSVRDRLMLGSQSLPKPGSPEFTALFAAAHHRDRGGGTGATSSSSSSSFTPRVLKPSDGSLSDTCSTYAAASELQGYYASNSPYATSWMRHSNTYTPSGRSQGMGLCEADSVESLGSHRASLTHARLLMHQRDSTGSPAPPRLNRSNSIRSTKSEKMYPSMLARGSGASSSVGEEVGVGVGVGVEPYYSVPVGSAGCTAGQHWSQPTSPTPMHASRQPPNLYQHVHKDDDIHGSSVSLVSTASSLYSSAEEKQAHELRKLRRELVDAQEKVHSLTSQLSTNAHVVSAFEQSLSNMTQRLQQLTATAEKKDSELQELRETIERLRKQSAEAGLNASANGRRHTLGDSESTTGCTGSNSNNHHHQGSSMARQLSADSVTSLNSLSSACSASSHHKKKGWLRSSFSKAFSRSRKNRHGSVSDAEDCKDGPSGCGGDLSAPNSPRLPSAVKHESQGQNQGHGSRVHSSGQQSSEHENGMSSSKSSSALFKKKEEEEDDEDVDELKKQLREKDMVLTDIRLEALSSAHQLESLKDTVIKMRNEMLNLKQNNERLQRLVTSKSLTSSQSSLPSDPERRFSMTEVVSSVAALSNGENASAADRMEDISVPEHPPAISAPSTTQTATEPSTFEQDTDGKRINVAVYLGSEKSFRYNMMGYSATDGTSEPAHCVIASLCVSNKTTWDALDSTVKRCFKDYVARVDPVTNLGLGSECVAAYHLGEASRRCTGDSHHLPELLPCGYLVGHVKTIYLVLSGYSWLAVDTLIPRSIVQRLVSLLTEHRRVILCGPSGTGKSYLAGKLAHALVDADADGSKDAAAVATFNVDHKSSKELRQYLAHIAERCDSNAADELPRVIILENLQHAASLGELFSGLLGTRHSSCPAIIGTMSQATCSTTNLQLHHNFRWVLCANHMEPVKGFLGRYLRRKLLEHELRESGGTRNSEMAAVVEWIPRVWLHLNKFLETHSSSDVTIGPRLFLSCPMEVAGSQVWFTDLWNYSVIPYLVEAVREGLTLYGRRVSGNGNEDSAWEDPAQFITSSYPWISTHAVHGGSDAILRLRPEDVGYDVTSGHTAGVGASSVKSLGSAHSDTESDPLLNMLMRLQEAANYPSPHSNDSDSVTSLDSSHTRHSEDLTCSTGVESTL